MQREGGVTGSHARGAESGRFVVDAAASSQAPFTAYCDHTHVYVFPHHFDRMPTHQNTHQRYGAIWPSETTRSARVSLPYAPARGDL
jgi:hypothetical protein